MTAGRIVCTAVKQRSNFYWLSFNQRDEMKASNQVSHNCRCRAVRLMLALIAVLVFQPAFAIAAQTGYEPLPVVSASRILPAELLTGPNHRVQDRVRSDGIVNIYTIDSRFGTFTAVSTANAAHPDSTKSTRWTGWINSRAPKNTPIP